MTPRGEVLEFRSDVDGLPHPLPICATDDSPEPKALLLDVSPGAIVDLDASVGVTEHMARVAADAGHGCVALRPTGRGPGTVYQDYGEVDVHEAIEAAADRYPIDRDRILITGFSMGGAATWYLLAHYPDLFAAAAPFCGYADYRLWSKPGGGTFPMRPWEEASWCARSAATLVENLDRVPLWVVHGAWDRALGGGVSVEHSRSMVSALQARGAPVRYAEVAGVGHDLDRDERWDDALRWLLEQRRDRDPDRVTLATWTLRHNESRWVRIDQLRRYGERGSVEAMVGPDGTLRVTTANVATLTLGPRREGTRVRRIEIDGADVGPTNQSEPSDLSDPVTFRARQGAWTAAAPPRPGDREKRHGASGPVGDLFQEGTILVPGTIGGDEATFFNAWAAEEAAILYRTRNGGVHRGGILGANWVDLPVVRDVDLSAEDRAMRNLLCYGTPASNAILRDYADRLPIDVGPGRIRLADLEWRDPMVSALAVFPHPDHPDRYVAMHGGPTPDAVTYGSHIDLALVPDYLVYAGGETLAHGFWGNDWRSQEGS
jgi:predicted esterase